MEGAAAAHSSRSHHAAEGTAGAPATAAAHSSRSHHAADTTSTSSTAVTAHSSRSHHTTDGAVAHSSRSHHTDNTGSAASATAAHSSRSHHTMDSAAAATAAAVHSSRSHHAQQEKQDEKKPVIAGLSTSRATAMDYREYREKKERERLEREKAVAVIGCHITDPNKHHSHHKPVSNASMPNKHQMPSVQKGTSLHHNHHHRPDIKVGQPVPQRHSASGQPNRDPSRQRLSREHNAGVASTSAGIAHSHSHANLDSSSSESASHRSDSSAVQDSVSSTHSSLQEKMSNNHSGHRLNALDSKHQAHDKRLYRGEDPRLKSAKYADMNRIENQRRKAEEQRCEEVRKLIEKPLPPPKQADIPYLINAQQKQQAHHAKYNQQQQDKGSSFTGDLKHATTISQNTLPQGTSPSASSSQKSALVKTQMYNQHTVQGVSQILKDTIKNGNSQSCLTTLNNMDATKSEKRSRSTVHEEFAERNSVDVQQGNLHTPPGKHRSLFSPEPPVVHRESHAQGARPKSKQKTPPSAATKLKERVSPFASSPTLQDSLSIKRLSSNDGAVSAHKRIRTSSISESEQPMKIKTEIKTEDTTSLEAMKMLGRVPDLIQPIRDNPSSSNGRNSSASSVINDLKPPELIKPFESDQPRFNTMSQHKGSSINVNALTNGMDLNVIKQELPEPRAKRDLLEHYIKKEQSEDLLEHYIKKEPGVAEPTHSQTKPEYTSPMKSAQSISALLQETLAPLPSLLQGLQQSSQLPSQQVHQEPLQHQQQQHQLQSVQHSLMDHQLPVTTQCLSISSDNFTPIASTVDISVLSDNVSMTLPSNNSMAEMAVPAASTVTTVPPVEEKRSEHHKSEKKKKKEKHKHKDKEKSKEKHKHKHKDKDKEKHREKKDKEKSEEMLAAAPIKITIPKDKLNLGTEASPTVVGGGPGSLDKNISPQSTGLKIKIPKERLKGTDNVPSSSPAQPPMVQAPLKIKIRTDGMSRSSAAAPPSLTSSSSNGSSHMQISSESSVNETTSRKRERVEMIGDSSGSSGLLSTKKQAMMIPPTGYGQGHRPGERQNGRHYNSGSNNKVRGRGVRQHHGGRGPPPHHAVAGQRGNAGGHYQREIYGNGRGSRGHQHHQAPYHSHQSHHPPAVRGDVSGYARGTGHADQGTDPYFYANYPTMFNASAGYMYDPAYQQYYQQFQQSQYSMYPAGSNLIMTPDGAINTSVPPPSLLPNHLYQNQNMIHSQSAVSTRQEDLLPPPPLQPPPSPPPLPSGPPPPPPPPPPPSTSE